ncbi:cytochrome P450 [Atractiella rhizophila]|nr:cytochrome P450 [Atractiella rhizophila]
MICLLNLLLHPEIVQKAQEEIDEVVGKDRLPEFEDRDSLPYCTNIVYETMRYQPVSPLGVPHKSLEDEYYRGMLIPKGSVVFANAWAMCHDPEVYADPSTFDPCRYYPKEKGGNNEPIPVGQFGFGRRVCVGRHLAVNSLWIIVVTLLATLKVQRPKDKDGNEIIPEIEFTSGLSSHPKAFGCDLKARSKSHAELVFNSTN